MVFSPHEESKSSRLELTFLLEHLLPTTWLHPSLIPSALPVQGSGVTLAVMSLVTGKNGNTVYLETFLRRVEYKIDTMSRQYLFFTHTVSQT